MPTTLRRLRRLALAPAIIALAASCENSVSVAKDQLAGSYAATSFLMTTGGTTYNFIGLGGSMVVTIAADSTITGTLTVPAGLPNLTPGTANLAGKVRRTTDLLGLVFEQASQDTFVPLLVWQQFTDALVSTTAIGNTQFQITLRK